MNIDINHLFTYHPPSPEQVVVYDRIKAGFRTISETIDHIARGTPPVGVPPIPDYGPMYQEINASCRAAAELMVEHCPPSADLSAAIRCLRLVRNACNEFVVSRSRQQPDVALLAIARAELFKARWQANSSIALHRPTN